MPVTGPTNGPVACCTTTVIRPSHEAAQVDDDHLTADLVIAMGRNHARILRDLGVPAERLRMLRSFDPRSAAHPLDVEDPYYGTHDDFEDVFAVIEASLPGLHDWVDERLAGPGTGQLMLSRFAFLLRPQWLALYVVVLGFAYLCFTVLAPWQLGKNTTTSRENGQISYSLSADPVPVTQFLPHQDSSAPDAAWRRVTATGTYHPDAQVLARLRVVNSDQALEVLVPFTVDGGPTVLVDRGFVRPAPGSNAPEMAALPRGRVTITARLRNSEAVYEGKEPFRQNGAQQVYSINTAQISALTGVPLAGSYLQLVGDQPGGLGEIPLPHLDAGPFLSYGIQWIAFGIIAPIGVGYFVLAEVRQRRRERAETAARPQAGTPLTTDEKLADRYGRRR